MSIHTVSKAEETRSRGKRLPLAFVILIGLLIIVACAPDLAMPTNSTGTPDRRTAAVLGPTSTASITPTARATLPPTATLVPIPDRSPFELSVGPNQATVTLVVYSDFDCDLCAQVSQDLLQIQFDHPNSVRYVYRPFPLLGVHEKSAQAAAAYLAAREFDQEDIVHEAFIRRRQEWSALTPSEFRDWIMEVATAAGMDPSILSSQMTSPETLQAVEEAYDRALATGIPGVPFLILNDRPYLFELSRVNLEAAVRLALLQDMQFDTIPDQRQVNQLPKRAELIFNFGRLEVQLLPRSAPQALSSFIFLAENGWYDGTALYDVRPGHYVKGGDPTNTGLGNAGYHFGIEIDPTYQFDQPGILALDNDGPGTNSSRFMITLEPRPDLNGSYTIIGKVVNGIEQLEQLSARDPIADLVEPPEGILEKISFE